LLPEPADGLHDRSWRDDR